MPTPTIEKSEIYIKKSKEVHGDRYDYSLSQPIYRLHDKTTIICKIHGKFEQSMASHIYQQAHCPKCSNCYKKTSKEVVAEMKKTHGKKYEYIPFEYKNNKQQVKIICKKHGEFEQGVKEHINGSGCPRCKPNFKKTTETFIESAKEKHGDRFIYDRVDYQGNEKLVIITCREHGEFLQTPHAHLAGYGCKRCSANSSYKGNEWLDSLGIELLNREFRIKIGKINYRADGYDPKTNTVYEFHGDYFHGNPKFYKPNWRNKKTGKKFSEHYQQTLKKKEDLIKAGYNYVEMWESDFVSKERKNFAYKKADYSVFEPTEQYCMDFINMWRYAEGEDFYIGNYFNILKQAKEKIV